MYKVRACFEVAGLAVDENGNPTPAGLQIQIGEALNEFPYDELISHIDLNKVAATIHVDPSAITVITPEEYDEKYGDEDGEEE